MPLRWSLRLHNETHVHPRTPSVKSTVGKALHTRASAASEWSPAEAERTVKLATAGVRRVQRELCGTLAPHVVVCESSHMATNLAIDEKILDEALRVGGHSTKKATVTEALLEYIQRRKQGHIVALFGKIDVDPSYDYKKQRRRK